MLQSPDKENNVLALCILEEQAKQTHIAALMLFYKSGRSAPEVWREHAPSCFNLLDKLPESTNGIRFSYEHIFRKMEESAPKHVRVFILSSYVEFLAQKYGKGTKILVIDDEQ
jgi:hypothetical protein